MITVMRGGAFGMDNHRCKFTTHPCRQGTVREPTDTALCHSISFHTIQVGITAPLNQFLSNKIDWATCCKCLQQLIFAVTLGQSTDVMIGLLHDALSHDQKKIDLDRVNHLLFELNNTPFNLRVGDRSWNSSIQQCFDPTFWVHLDDDRNVDSCHIGLLPAPIPLRTIQGIEGIGIGIRVLLELETLSQEINGIAVPVLKNNTFYLYDINDGIALYHIFNTMGSEEDRMQLLTTSYPKAVNNQGVPFICSSSNMFELIRTDDSDCCGDPIYYSYYDEWYLF